MLEQLVTRFLETIIATALQRMGIVLTTIIDTNSSIKDAINQLILNTNLDI